MKVWEQWTKSDSMEFSNDTVKCFLGSIKSAFTDQMSLAWPGGRESSPDWMSYKGDGRIPVTG